MFIDKTELKDFDKMDAEYKDLLGRVLTIQADCEIGGPHLYVEKMLPGGAEQARSAYSGARRLKKSIIIAKWRGSRVASGSTFPLC